MRKIQIGDVFTTNNCGDCVVVEYINYKKVKVKFITTGYECWCKAVNMLKGEVKDLYHPSVCGVGYMGGKTHLSKDKGVPTKTYYIWKSILERCYSIKDKRYIRYGGRGVTVCKEWHNFQNFAQWVVKQPNYNKDGFDLDKDLKVVGCKEYSPNTCSFVPHTVNTLLIASNKSRGKYPVGVHWCSRDGRFISQCWDNGRYVRLGCYQTQEEAFQAYKTYKESIIREIAIETYNQGNIIKEVYDNLMEWEVIPFPE